MDEPDDWYEIDYDGKIHRDIMYCSSCDLFIGEEYAYAGHVPYCLQCGAIVEEVRCLQDIHGEWCPEDQFAYGDEGLWPY
jgi:hypothetical protein